MCHLLENSKVALDICVMSLRAQRGNLAALWIMLKASGLPLRSAPRNDDDWAYSDIFGFFYTGVASVDSPWFYPVDQNIGTWINSSDTRSTSDGFWAYAADNGDNTSGLSGWLWFAVEASEADSDNWFVYQLDTDTFHSFSDL